MGLETYARQSAFIPFGSGEGGDGITVSALSLDDIGSLISENLGAIADSLESYQQLKATMAETGTMDRFMITVITAMPGLAAALICTAAGLPDLRDKAKDLAFGIQIRALNEIARMTLEDVGGIKNLFAALAPVLSGLQLPQMMEARRTSQTH